MSDREPALTHVSVWSGNGWKHITADEAVRLHTGGTVSARWIIHVFIVRTVNL